MRGRGSSCSWSRGRSVWWPRMGWRWPRRCCASRTMGCATWGWPLAAGRWPSIPTRTGRCRWNRRWASRAGRRWRTSTRAESARGALPVQFLAEGLGDFLLRGNPPLAVLEQPGEHGDVGFSEEGGPGQFSLASTTRVSGEAALANKLLEAKAIRAPWVREKPLPIPSIATSALRGSATLDPKKCETRTKALWTQGRTAWSGHPVPRVLGLQTRTSCRTARAARACEGPQSRNLRHQRYNSLALSSRPGRWRNPRARGSCQY